MAELGAKPFSIVAPLEDNETIIEIISRATDKDPAQVLERLFLEERSFPYNVPTEYAEKQIPRWEWTEELLEFYRETDSFLYETFVWNRHPIKQTLRETIARFLDKASGAPQKILCYGDGLGFESVFFSMLGHDVTYYEVSRYGERVVRELADLNGVAPSICNDETEIAENQWDAMVCLDVLEHVPDPPAVIDQFKGWLKPDGLLFVNAPFFMVNPLFPTHLKSNLKYSGELKEMYLSRGFALLDGAFLWSPIVLQNEPASRRKSLSSSFGKFKMFWGGLLMKAARVIPGPLNWIVRFVMWSSRPDKWRKQLEQTRQAGKTTN